VKTEEILWITAKKCKTPFCGDLDRLIHRILIENRPPFHSDGIPTNKKLKNVLDT
jgi:hypothetical protein